MLSNIETLAANMQNVEKGIKAKHKNKNHEIVQQVSFSCTLFGSEVALHNNYFWVA